MAVPNNDVLSDATYALTIPNTAASTKNPGTIGYPHARYGRGTSGRVRRSTNTLAAPRPKKIQSANTTPLSKSPIRPRVITSSAIAHTPMITTDTCGDPNRGWTRAAAWRNTPSFAMAKKIRGVARITTFTNPRIDSMAAIEISVAPTEPPNRVAVSAATALLAASPSRPNAWRYTALAPR